MESSHHDELMQRLADVIVQQRTIHDHLRAVMANHAVHMTELNRAVTAMTITLAEVRALLMAVTPHAHMSDPSC